MEELEFLKKLVKQAYNQRIKGKEKIIEMKEHKSFTTDLVTSCDKETEIFITEKIKKKYPYDRIIGEEFSNDDSLKGRCWVIDPIDGTVNFANNLPIWCIQVAFVENDITKASVIYIPSLNELYSADETGAYLNGKKLSVNKSVKVGQSLNCISDFDQKTQEAFDFQLKYIKNLYQKLMKIKFIGSVGYEMALVASSKVQSNVMINNNIWDILPGEFIARMAGAEMIYTKLGDKKVTIACNNIDLLNTIKDMLNNKKY